MAAATTKVAAYGSWASPISADDVARASIRLGQVQWSDGRLWWGEGRPEEGGRGVVVSADAAGKKRKDHPQAPYAVHSAVHEYGGGAFCVCAGHLAFVNSSDQAVYLQNLQAGWHAPIRLTPAGENAAYADLQYDAYRNRLIAVREDHGASPEPRASLVGIGLSTPGATPVELVSGFDFLASPRLSPDGSEWAWLAWNHPDMPWDSTQLWRAGFDADGGSHKARCCAGGPSESLFNPLYSPAGRLYVVSDASGWWNICRVEGSGLTAITGESAEFGMPQWVFGQSTYDFDDDGCLFAIFTIDGLWQMAAIDEATGRLDRFDLPFTHLEQLRVARGRIAFIGGSATEPPTLCSMTTDGLTLRRLRTAGESRWDTSLMSTPRTLQYPTADGETAHALFYPPRNPSFSGPSDQLPPLLIKVHGGPTGASSTALDPRIQYWTSRGFAVLDVNYRGSTGYGRDYRRGLYGRWGIADVQDCEYGLRYLDERGLVDAARVVISGASAGGYTVLCVLTWSRIAAAGASYYGISDLRRLLASTHKFESRYLGRLIGEDDSLLDQRSPLFHAERIDCPVLFLQGGKDKVVPPDQADAMAAVLRQRGIAVAQLDFPEERHGFRVAENIIRSLQGELAFYARVLGFEPAETLPELPIDNL